MERLAGRSAHPHWIVGRGLCMYRRQDFTNVPKNRRRTAVELQLPVWSPFRNTGHHTVWQGSEAMVWFWDADTVAEAQQAFRATPAGRDAPSPEDLHVLPETIFLPRQDDGVRLQPCRAGFELQHWRDSVLEDAFWFPDRPDADQLDSFLARQGAPNAAAARAVQNGAAESLRAEHAAEPWASPVAPPSGCKPTNARSPPPPSCSWPSSPSGRKPATGRSTAWRSPPRPSSRRSRKPSPRSSPPATRSWACAAATRP